MNTIITIDQIAELNKHLKQQHQRIVLVGGCFDILHIGHIDLLEQAKQLGDILIILLESDETIAENKGNSRPLHTQQQRAKVLEALKTVDYIILLNPHMTNQDYDKLVNLIQPDIIATTKGDPGWSHKERQAKLVGAQLVAANQPLANISTSKIVSTLQKEL